MKHIFCPPKTLYDPTANPDGSQGTALPPMAQLIEQGKVIALNRPVAMNPGLVRAIGTKCYPALSPEEERHRHRHDGAALGGIKGSLAALGGCAALDTASAPRRLAFVDGTPDLWAPFAQGQNDLRQ